MPKYNNDYFTNERKRKIYDTFFEWIKDKWFTERYNNKIKELQDTWETDAVKQMQSIYNQVNKETQNTSSNNIQNKNDGDFSSSNEQDKNFMSAKRIQPEFKTERLPELGVKEENKQEEVIPELKSETYKDNLWEWLSDKIDDLKQEEEQKKGNTIENWVLNKWRFERKKWYTKNFDIINNTFDSVIDAYKKGWWQLDNNQKQALASELWIDINEINDPESIFNRLEYTDEGKRKFGITDAEDRLKQTKEDFERKKQDMRDNIERVERDANIQIQSVNNKYKQITDFMKAQGAWSWAIASSAYQDGINNVLEEKKRILTRINNSLNDAKQSNTKNYQRLIDTYEKWIKKINFELDEKIKNLKFDYGLNINSLEEKYWLDSDYLTKALNNISKDFSTKAVSVYNDYLKNMWKLNEQFKNTSEKVEWLNKTSNTKYKEYIFDKWALLKWSSFVDIINDVASWNLSEDHWEQLKTLMENSVINQLQKEWWFVNNKIKSKINKYFSEWLTPTQIYNEIRRDIDYTSQGWEPILDMQWNVATDTSGKVIKRYVDGKQIVNNQVYKDLLAQLPATLKNSDKEKEILQEQASNLLNIWFDRKSAIYWMLYHFWANLWFDLEEYKQRRLRWEKVENLTDKLNRNANNQVLKYIYNTSMRNLNINRDEMTQNIKSISDLLQGNEKWKQRALKDYLISIDDNIIKKDKELAVTHTDTIALLEGINNLEDAIDRRVEQLLRKTSKKTKKEKTKEDIKKEEIRKEEIRNEILRNTTSSFLGQFKDRELQEVRGIFQFLQAQTRKKYLWTAVTEQEAKSLNDALASWKESFNDILTKVNNLKLFTLNKLNANRNLYWLNEINVIKNANDNIEHIRWDLAVFDLYNEVKKLYDTKQNLKENENKQSVNTNTNTNVLKENNRIINEQYEKDKKRLIKENPNEASFKNDNPTWITYTPSLVKKYKSIWIDTEKWSPRPKNEWWNYIKFKSLSDWLKAYEYSLTKEWPDIFDRLKRWKGTKNNIANENYSNKIMKEAWIKRWTKFTDLTEDDLLKLMRVQLKYESGALDKYLQSFNKK